MVIIIDAEQRLKDLLKRVEKLERYFKIQIKGGGSIAMALDDEDEDKDKENINA